MSKITYGEYLDLVRNPETKDALLLSFSRVVRGEGGFDFVVKPDPDKVELKEEDIAFENALQIGNGMSRFRRQAKFNRRKMLGSDLSVLVSEGDSWFQFPLLVNEIIDQLEDDYLIWSVGAAGDTAQNIVYNRAEYLPALKKHKEDVCGFLFSAAGNDIIGEDPKSNRAVLFDLLKDFNGNTEDIEEHINMDLFKEKLQFLKGAYTKVIQEVRAETGFEHLPIFIHGYDYVFPSPWGDNDPRNPIHADKKEWLGEPLDYHKIYDQHQRRNIIKFMIDRLYDMLGELSGDSKDTSVWLVDCRGAMPEVSDWIDEIHGTSEGFQKVASRFKSVISQALSQ